MQVPQWAGPIPMGRKGRLGPRAMSEGGTTILITSKARISFFKLAGSSRVYVFRAILIKCEPTYCNSTVLQVSN